MTDEFIFLFLLALIFITYRKPDWGAKYLRLGMILIVFTLPLLRLWETGESTWNIVLGLLPWADATEYYFDANRLIGGDLFSAFSGRRPLYTGLLAVFLEISNQNLQATLILFAIINALAAFFFAEDVRNEWGCIPAIVVIYLCQLFYRPFVGTTLTEQFGYPVGLLALVVLLRAVKTSRLWLFSLGMMLLTYALLIRAGAFFVLLTLMAFAVIKFAENRQHRLKVLLLMVIAVAIPIISNNWLGSVIASPDTVRFANFADTLYGQSRGGVRWTQAAIDHPELTSMAEPLRSRMIYRLAFQEIISNPLGLIRGSIRAWVDFILPGPLSAFGFVTFGNKAADFLLQLSAALMFLFGLWKTWQNKKKPFIMFLLAYWAGTFLSIPFLPPVDAGVRPYAATIASIFLPVCFVFSHPLFERARNSLHEHRIIPVGISYNMAFALILFSLLGAPLLKTIAPSASVQPVVCDPEYVPVSFRLTHGSYISLSSADDLQKTTVPVVLLTDVRKSFDDFPYGDFAGILRKVKQPVLIAVTNDISTGAGIWVIAPSELKSYEGQMISACAKPSFATYTVLHIDTFSIP